MVRLIGRISICYACLLFTLVVLDAFVPDPDNSYTLQAVGMLATMLWVWFAIIALAVTFVRAIWRNIHQMVPVPAP